MLGQELHGRLGVRSAACIVLLSVCLTTGTAIAQTEDATNTRRGPNRAGFSLLLTMGVGLQNQEALNESTTGLGGLNLGIGGFISPDLAVMFRFSGTNVTFDDVGPFQRRVDSVSGVGGPAIQYWVSDYVNVEGGLGLGIANTDPGTEESGFGVILGVGFSFFHRGKNSLQIGVEYAPVFIDAGNVHNVSIAFGWQLL